MPLSSENSVDPSPLNPNTVAGTARWISRSGGDSYRTVSDPRGIRQAIDLRVWE